MVDIFLNTKCTIACTRYQVQGFKFWLRKKDEEEAEKKK